MSDPSVTTAGGPLLQIFLQSNNEEHTLGGNAAPPMLLIGGQQTSSVKGQRQGALLVSCATQAHWLPLSSAITARKQPYMMREQTGRGVFQ